MTQEYKTKKEHSAYPVGVLIGKKVKKVKKNDTNNVIS